MATGYSNELGEFPVDERVDAIVPLAPAVSSNSFSDETLATIEVPMWPGITTDTFTCGALTRRSVINASVMPSFVDSFDVVVAELGDDAAILGAAAWVQQMVRGSAPAT